MSPDRPPAAAAGDGITFANAPGLFPGAPYHYAAVAPPDRLVFSAGACPIDEHGVVVAPGDLTAQARLAADNLVRALAAAGAAPGDVLKTTVYVVATERAQLVAAWDVVSGALLPHRPPSTLLGVSVLGYRDQLVEVEAVAVVRGRRPG